MEQKLQTRVNEMIRIKSKCAVSHPKSQKLPTQDLSLTDFKNLSLENTYLSLLQSSIMKGFGETKSFPLANILHPYNTQKLRL